MRVIVLGSGAGGGFPQWNCLCPNCQMAWKGDARFKHRTQSSLAISSDGNRWLLLNASPDLRQQIIATPALHPKGAARHSPIAGVFVTNGDVDHLTGLLTLREQQPFTIYGSRATLAQTQGGVFGVLNPDLVKRTPVALGETVDPGLGFSITAFAVPGKTPLYMEDANLVIGEETETTIALDITSNGKRVVYAPGVAKITDALVARVDGADALFFDGTTYTDDEMVKMGLSSKTAWRMGHVPMSGASGSVEGFKNARVGAKIFIHINNSNPVLCEDAPERGELAQAGWRVGYDGMEIVL
ncbi:MAG: pyrroloquinoline quinone biosynthesis protein PqqB [Hyphomicrobiales bacterium]|nr:pyrroloquinoline quinone biosynthesis protein PqqB [Hyphomicrobiales bacterium]